MSIVKSPTCQYETGCKRFSNSSNHADHNVYLDPTLFVGIAFCRFTFICFSPSFSRHVERPWTLDWISRVLHISDTVCRWNFRRLAELPLQTLSVGTHTGSNTSDRDDSIRDRLHIIGDFSPINIGKGDL